MPGTLVNDHPCGVATIPVTIAQITMSFCKNNAIRCDTCNKFCIPFDDEIPYGCNNPESPEPLDPFHYCKPCSYIEKQKWINNFNKGSRYGNWQKSKAESEAADECGLVWIDSKGIGEYGTPAWKNYCYVTREEALLK